MTFPADASGEQPRADAESASVMSEPGSETAGYLVGGFFALPIVFAIGGWLFGVYGGLGAVVSFVCIGVAWLLKRREDRMDPLADR